VASGEPLADEDAVMSGLLEADDVRDDLVARRLQAYPLKNSCRVW
jgi:hypothetical protein